MIKLFPCKVHKWCSELSSGLYFRVKCLVDHHFTRQYNPEDSSEHHTRRREKFKSHKVHKCYLISPKNGNASYLGSLCQYSHEGMKLRDPRDVSGPSKTPSETWVFSTVALSVATAWVCVRPIRLVPFTFSRISPFCNHTLIMFIDQSVKISRCRFVAAIERWDFRFSQWWVTKWLSSGMLHHVAT
jgi:hypothetical protein